jgi:hypothetical protein
VSIDTHSFIFSASKRERDKIEHEESTRKRVQHEEQELSNKIQEMLQATGLLPSLERTERWNQPDNADDKLRQETFSTWFEMKLSELVGTATWDLEFNVKGNEIAKKKYVNVVCLACIHIILTIF